MTRIVLSLLLISGVVLGQGATKVPRIVCADSVWNFGQLSQNVERHHDFTVKNVGTGPLRIKQVRPTCSCTAVLPEKRLLQPGESTVIETTLKTSTFKGEISKTITVVSNDPKTPHLQLTVKGEILPPFYVKPSQLQFNEFAKNSQSEELGFSFVVTPGSAVGIEGVSASSELIKIERGPDGSRADGSQTMSYRVRVQKGAPVGLFRENITVTTNMKALPPAVITVTSNVAGEVALSQQNLNFGSCKAGAEAVREIIVSKSGDPNLELAGIEVSPPGSFSAAFVPVEKGRKYKVSVTLNADAKSGYTRGHIVIKTNCPGETEIKAYCHAFVSRR